MAFALPPIPQLVLGPCTEHAQNRRCCFWAAHLLCVTPLLQLTGSHCSLGDRNNFYGGLTAQPTWTMQFKMTRKGNRRKKTAQVARIGIWALGRNHRVGSTWPWSHRACTEYRGTQSITDTDIGSIPFSWGEMDKHLSTLHWAQMTGKESISMTSLELPAGVPVAQRQLRSPTPALGIFQESYMSGAPCPTCRQCHWRVISPSSN